MNIREQKEAADALRIAALVYEHSSEAMMVTDADNRILSINPAFTRITGYGFDEVAGRNPQCMSSGRHDVLFYRQMWDSLLAKGTWCGEVWNRRKNGEEYPEWLTINTITAPDGSVHRYLAQFSDITEKKRTEETIWRQANFDSLTGLPNRRLLLERLAHEMRKAERSGLAVAALFIDLDDFKQVNDVFGHNTGDLLLVEASRRIASQLRATDIVARLSGDEFVAILPDFSHIGDIERVAQDMLQALAMPFSLQNETAFVSASIGVAFYPQDVSNAEELIRYADQAMYAAKGAGRNRHCYFTAAMQQQSVERMRLLQDLRVAIEKKQLRLHFQPVVDLADGSVLKAEALVRWQHPERGMVGPAAFIPVAEETGLIAAIGDWVFCEAARWASRWSALTGKTFQVSVNKSPLQFLAPKSLSWTDYLRSLGLPGQAIVVEITEGVLLNASGEVGRQLQSYRDAGMQIAIDDFGTGYSSMAYVKKLVVDYLKIDRSFIRDMATNDDDRAIAETIILMARRLGIKVIAEGIETEEQKALLRAAGCQYGQGYLFSHPLPPEKFETLLQAQHPEPEINPAEISAQPQLIGL